MYHVALTPNEYPANALSVKSPTLLGALSDLLNALDQANESGDWIAPHVLEAAKEAIDNLENDEPAKGVWSDMGCEDDAFSIDIFCEDDARYVECDELFLLAPHGAVGLAIGELNFQRWIYDESELPEWDEVLLPHVVYQPSEDGLDAAVRSVVNGDSEERCEHTGMTRDELESLCGTPAIAEHELIGKRCWFNYPEEFKSLPQYSERRGYECLVIRQLSLSEADRGNELERIFLVRFEDFIELHAYESELDPIIAEQRADAKITELIRDVKDGDCALSAIFDDGSTRKLFNFYIDELAFFDADLIGKTEGEAHQLHHARTIAYIQS